MLPDLNREKTVPDETVTVTRACWMSTVIRLIYAERRADAERRNGQEDVLSLLRSLGHNGSLNGHALAVSLRTQLDRKIWELYR